MKAAIYSRKSKESDKGDSIENQINMCISQLNLYGITDYEIFQDYGISGKNTNRPEFQDMMKRVKSKEFTHLVCYKLDRISRSVADFSIFVDELQSYDVAFISVKEQFDTSSPMGRAMMYMLSVFAQFERETISERVSDNMLEMAKNGRFLAGQAPLGYKRGKVQTEDGKTYTKLILDDEWKGVVRLIYDKLFEIGSKSGVKKWLANNGYRTKRGALYGDNAITTIIDNFVYLEATTKSCEYLEGLGYKVYNKELLNKGYGYLHYNKQRFNSNKKYDLSDQIIAVSTHSFIITLEQHQKAKTIVKNNNKYINNGKQINAALLTGLIKCHKCGASYVTVYGRNIRYYKCLTKKNYTSKHCNSKALRAEELEIDVINTLKELFKDKGSLLDKLKENSKDNKTIKASIDKKIGKTRLEMKNIANAIAKTGDSDLLIEEYNVKKEYLENLEIERNKSLVDNMNYLIQRESVSNFINLIDTLDLPRKRMLLQDIVKQIHYDEKTDNIVIELFNEQSINSLSHP